LVKERQEVALLTGELNAQEEQIKKLGVNLKLARKETQTYKKKLENWQK
jgi:hypothetical protein